MPFETVPEVVFPEPGNVCLIEKLRAPCSDTGECGKFI